MAHQVLSSAEVTARTVAGRFDVAWRVEAGEFHLELDAPEDCQVELILPGRPARRRPGGRIRETVPHRWPDQPPTTLRELIDDEPRWAAVVAAVGDTGYLADELELLRRLRSSLASPVAAVPSLLEAIAGPLPEGVRRALRADPRPCQHAWRRGWTAAGCGGLPTTQTSSAAIA